MNVSFNMVKRSKLIEAALMDVHTDSFRRCVFYSKNSSDDCFVVFRASNQDEPSVTPHYFIGSEDEIISELERM